jgi:Xaa-Pro dipeptidase
VNDENMKIPISVFKERMDKVIGRLNSENLKGLVIYATGSSLGFAGRTHGYMRYLCDWDPLNLAAGLILLPERNPILLVPARSPQLFARELMWFDDIRAIQWHAFGQEIVSILKPFLASGDKMGYIGKAETPAPLYEMLQENSQTIKWIEANHILDELRIVKDDLAIGFHRHAAEICDEMFIAFKREIRKSKMAFQLQADLEHVARFAGCEYVSTFLSIGPVVDRPRYAKRECLQIPQNGDQVLLSLFAMYDGHWGHAIRTGAVGKPNKAQQRAFDIAFEMQEAALERVKPGVDLNEVWKASEKVLSGYYPDARDSDWYWLKTGHGLGLDYSDPILSDIFPNPFSMAKKGEREGLSNESLVRIQPGMLFEIHPNIFIPNEAAGAIGNMVLVTENGYEILDRFPRDFFAL